MFRGAYAENHTVCGRAMRKYPEPPGRAPRECHEHRIFGKESGLTSDEADLRDSFLRPVYNFIAQLPRLDSWYSPVVTVRSGARGRAANGHLCNLSECDPFPKIRHRPWLTVWISERGCTHRSEGSLARGEIALVGQRLRASLAGPSHFFSRHRSKGGCETVAPLKGGSPAAAAGVRIVHGCCSTGRPVAKSSSARAR
jgi:hypothetical protein